nr:ATP synthase F0 subunit 8 [Actinopyga echinites]
MPQLDLTWFIINFLVSWSLIVIVLFLLLNQEFETTLPENSEKESFINENKNNLWLW